MPQTLNASQQPQQIPETPQLEEQEQEHKDQTPTEAKPLELRKTSLPQLDTIEACGCRSLPGKPKVEAIGDKALKWMRSHLCRHIK